MDGLKEKERILTTLNDLSKEEFQVFKWHLLKVHFEGRKPLQTFALQYADRMETVDLIVQNYTDHATQIVETVLRKVKMTDLQENQTKEFKSNLKIRLEHGENTREVDIYTEVYITVGGSGQVNKEHEIRQIELAYTKTAGPETPINMDDIVEPLLGKHIKTAMMTGVAGIGKSLLAQKFALNWAEDKANLHIDFVFPFTFRDLNLEMMEKKEYSMEGFLHHHFFGKAKKISICIIQQCNILFILDGLDDCRPPLCFPNTVKWTDPMEPTTVHVLLINLLRGNLLPKAKFLITSRPAAADQIPSVDRVTELRGFKDPQKKEYIFKRFTDEQLASKIYSHIQRSRSVHIMCHIPLYCWVTANVMEEILKTDKEGVLPNIQTTIYLHFMLNHSILRTDDARPLQFLGTLAFEQLKNGNRIFYERDLKASGIDIKDAAMYSEVFPQLFGEVRTRADAKKMFCFVHLSVQEFLAALHVLTTFINTGDNLLSTSKKPKSFGRNFKSKIHHLYESAVNQALQRPNGHLDLFLRFLLGLSLETNQQLLETLLIQKGKSFQTNDKTIKYIKKKIRENPSPERICSTINLFHCLKELNDHSLEEDIQQYLTSGHLSTDELSSAQWSALVFVLLSSGKELDVFDLKKYSASEEALLGLLPVLQASNKALLSGCNLSERCCQELSSALSSSSSLRELDLGNNDLKDSGVSLLAEGLRSPHCMLETLNLSYCNLSERCCQELSSALSSSSSLRELDLGNNNLKDSGVHLLAEGLGSPHCMLETLNLSGCLVTEKGCSSLTSALRSNPSHLRELDLTYMYNHPGESGEAMLSAVVKDPRYRLDALSVDPGGEHMLTPGMKTFFSPLAEMFQKLKEESNQAVIERDQKLGERDQLLREKDQELGEREQLLREKDQTLGEKDNDLQGLNNQVEKLTVQLKQSDSELEKSNQGLRERDQKLGERDQLLREKDQELGEREQLLREKDQTLGEKDNDLQGLNNQVEKLTVQLKQSDSELEKSNQGLRERDQKLGERDQLLREKDQELGEKDNDLQGLNNQVEKLTVQLKQSDSELEKSNQGLRERDQKLGERDQLLREKDQTLGEREQLLREKDQTLGEKDNDLQGLNNQVEKLTVQLKQSDSELEKSNQGLRERDQKLGEKDKSLQGLNNQMEKLIVQLTQTENNLEKINERVRERDEKLGEKEQLLKESNKLVTDKDRQVEQKDEEMKKMKEEWDEVISDKIHSGAQPRLTEIQDDSSAEKKLFCVRPEFVRRVSDATLKSLLDKLHENKVIIYEEMEAVTETLNRAGKARKLIDMVRMKGNEPCFQMIDVIHRLDPYLSEELKLTSELRLVLLGSSTAGNILLGSEDAWSSSQQSWRRNREVCGRQLVLMVLSGCSPEEMRQDVGPCLQRSAPGPHAFLLVLPAEPSEGEVRGMMEKMREMFGDSCWSHSIVIFIHEGREREQSVRLRNSQEHQLVQKCGDRWHVLSMEDGSRARQVPQLLEKIESMVAGNTQSFYSTKIYLEAEAEVTEMERKIHRDSEERVPRVMEEQGMRERFERELKDSLSKIEGSVQGLEQQLREERDEGKRRKLKQQRAREVERREEKEKHWQDMEAMREIYEREARVEAEMKMMKVVLPEMQRSIMFSKTEMQREFNRQMEEMRQIHEREASVELNRQMEEKIRELNLLEKMNKMNQLM